MEQETGVTDEGDNTGKAAPHGVDVERIVRHVFNDNEMQEMTLSCVPVAVQIRNILNSVGFKFEDDGKPSLIINEDPVPLGQMLFWRDLKEGTVNYKQILQA